MFDNLRSKFQGKVLQITAFHVHGWGIDRGESYFTICSYNQALPGQLTIKELNETT